MSSCPIRAVGLHKTYRSGFWMRRTEAVRGVDLCIEEGETFGLLGPNGSGKTTMIKMLTGLILPTSGEAWVSELPVQDPRSRARLGFLPEGTYFHEYLTGREFLEFHGTLLGLSRAERRERIPGLLERVGMRDAADQKIRSYSKGMQQRIGLAQALIGDPDLLVLDEPMSGLDPIGRKEVRDLILELREEGKTVFFSSHILADAELVCDRAAILVRGRIVHEGSLGAHLEQEIVSVELVVEGLEEALVRRLEADATRMTAQGASFHFEFGEESSAEKALDQVRAAGGRICSLVPRRRSLEDLMVELSREGAQP
jgi:ABC-2 type transport system ATP-binding protein